MRDPLPNVATGYLPFDGGLDTETPPWSIKPGYVREAQNYEVGINGGYQDIRGYERFDGRTKPSDATYSIINVTITGTFTVGATVTQLVSGATGVIIAVVTTTTPKYLVLTKVTGTFDNTHDLQVGAVTQGTALSAANPVTASTQALHATYLNLAADEYRDDITAVPGSGSILGVWMLGNTVYAARNDVAGTAAAIYKSTTGGWSLVSLGRELAFTSGGTYVIAEGDTITGATSAATAVITRVVLTGGTWAGGDAAGRLIFASQTGTFQAENLNVGANLNVATIAGNSSAIVLSPNGRFETVNYNFTGFGGAVRTYGCDGVNRGFEFDGTVFAPIATGMTTDAPSHVAAHRNHLFFSFGASVQHSAPTSPYVWAPLLGATEIAIGETVTGFMVQAGDASVAALTIFGRNRTHTLYGTSVSNWNLIQHREEIGAYAYSIQQMVQTIFVDDRGLLSLRAAQDYGNFQDATLSQHIQRWIDQRKSLTVASCIVREKNQYRLFFSDNSALYVTFDGTKVRGMMPQLLEHAVTCAYSAENTSGAEVVLFGSDDGFVYQMEKGTSFDGTAIVAYLQTHFFSDKMLRVTKKFLSCTMEARGDGYAEIGFTYTLGYGSPSKPQPGSTTSPVDFAARNWDNGVWDAGYWDGRTLSPDRYGLKGSAENIALWLQKNSDEFEPVTFSGALIRHIPRRGIR